MKYMVEKLIEINDDIESICCIYATAPLISIGDLKESLEIIKKEKSDQILFGVTTFDYPIQRAVILDNKNNSSFLNKEFLYSRSQDLQETFHDAGQFYWGNVNAWLNTESILEGGKAFKIPRWRVQDIDVPEDWIRAENIHKQLNG